MSDKRKRLTQSEIDTARMFVIEQAVKRSLEPDQANTLIEAIKEAMRLSGREAVVLADFLERQGRLF